MSPFAPRLSSRLVPSQPPAVSAPLPGTLGQSQAGRAGRPPAGILGVTPLQTRVAGGNLGDMQDSPFVAGPRPLAVPRQRPAGSTGSPSPLSAGLGPGPARARDPERTRQAALQFAGELRAAETAVGLDRVIPQAFRRSLLIQGRVAQERAQGNLEQAQALESLGRDVGALPTGAGKERRYEFVRSGDGQNVGVRAQDVDGGRVVREQGAATVRYDDARDFFDRLAAPDGRRLDPGRTLAATVPLSGTD